MTMLIPSLHAVDPSLGRLDYDSLSDQALMEMMVEHIVQDDIDDIKDANGNFKDACEWKSMECTDGRVTVLEFVQRRFEPNKKFPFKFIPPCVLSFVMESCDIYGTLDTSLLPQSMSHMFSVTINELFGPLDFQGFPRNLKYLYLEENKFSGSCILANLPPALLEFTFVSNEFSGEIQIDDLPPALVKASVENNKLTGPIVITKLPQELEVLFLAKNSFSGEFQLFTFPPRLRVIDISSTKMSAKAVVRHATAPMHFALLHDFMISVVNENGDKHAWERKIKERIVSNANSLTW